LFCHSKLVTKTKFFLTCQIVTFPLLVFTHCLMLGAVQAIWRGYIWRRGWRRWRYGRRRSNSSQTKGQCDS